MRAEKNGHLDLHFAQDIVVLRLMAAPWGGSYEIPAPYEWAGCWCSALAFVRNCGVGPPPGFAFPVALHPYSSRLRISVFM